ncbi:MAG TPA: FumA C-terminus/TtdB family hydratase beta subunit [Bacillota bacterium]|nr:FumA C-terminus/TtdB family hydratase beta subunit [Bacillota bacterium]HPQ62075.1 FumA C-terminus/TtdB family hydratase beta subunit [Bacillota bacterium]HRX91729.1 FumA C-terminus/TtdB family hydratase beta subunit [Candidatus Izemoplasmatales bacterium]
MKKIISPICDKDLLSLEAGDEILLTGTIYTGRDAAHKLMCQAVEKKEKLPFDIVGQTIYYVGPTPAKPGMPIGSCGPTSSYRMDRYSPILMKHGLKVMIGKGERSEEFRKLMELHQGLYLIAIGGIGAKLASTVKKAELVAYRELESEAIYRLEVEDFPCIVAYDMHGGNVFKQK